MVCLPWFEFNPGYEDLHQGEAAVLVEFPGTWAAGPGAQPAAEHGAAGVRQELEIGMPSRHLFLGRKVFEPGLAEDVQGVG